MRAGRILVVAGFLIGAASVGFSLLPFHARVPIKGGIVLSSRPLRSPCGAPIMEAWRAQTTGWFGYAPLSSPSLPPHIGCRTPARNRLRASGLGLALASLLGAVAWFIDRRPRMDWRPRLRPTP